jgi:C4-dicarboxylate-specific signal transduction histidine kinase
MDEARAALTRIVRDARRAADVISGIRRLLKGGESRKGPLQIGDVIREVASLVEGEARSRRVMLRVEPDADLPPVVADRVQLQQVVLNLAMNAIEAMSASSPFRFPGIASAGLAEARGEPFRSPLPNLSLLPPHSSLDWLRPNP